MNNIVTAEEVSKACVDLRTAGLDPATANRGDIKRVCGIGDRRARTIREWVRRGGTEAGDTAESHDRKADSWAISLPKTRLHTLEQMVDHFKIDLSEWEVERWVCNKYDQASVPRATRGGEHQDWVRPKTEPMVTELYQVKVWLKRKSLVIAVKNELALLKAEAKLEAKAYPAILRDRSQMGCLLELAIPDLHAGKLAWAKETGWENYDLDIAESVFEEALTKLLWRSSSYPIDRIIFPVGNDLFHTDSKAPMTTAGTLQDVDGRYQRTFVRVRKMITRAIERLREIVPVDVPLISGNHDTLSVWHLGDSLECLFAKCPDVTIDNGPSLRKYYEYGKVMLMFAHGNKGKLTDYPLVMATEQPEMFGRTKHREAHTGDKHQLKVQELHGVRVRISPALCPPDAWHAESMYVGNPRAAEAFVWHSEEGLIGQATFSVPAPDRSKSPDNQ